MRRWLQQRGNVDTAGEIVRAALQIEAGLIAGMSDRFIHIHLAGKSWVPVTPADEIKQQTPKLFAGYVKPDRVLVRSETWRQYCNGYEPGEIAEHFKQRGVLIPGDSSLSRAEQVIGTVGRFYVLSRASLTTITP